MRLISDFHDYYDCVQGFDHERDIVYQRKTEELWSEVDFFNEEKEDRQKSWGVFKHWLNRSYRYNGDYHYDNVFSRLQRHKICFCGKIYVAYSIFLDGKETFFYDIDSVDKFIETQPKKVREQYLAKDKKYYKSQRERDCKRDSIAQRLSNQGKPSVAATYCQVNALPIVATPWSVVLNGPNPINIVFSPNLKDYEFFRIKDAYTAYQEIYQFMANVAFPNRPIPDVSDKDMIVAKGFDLKTSFRKEKQK